MTAPLQVVKLDGINTDSLGLYLAGLGILSVVSQKWPNIRGCWHNGRFALVAAALSINDIEAFVAAEWQPRHYERWWSAAQKRDTKARSSLNLWAERNDCAADEVRVLDAHIVPLSRNQFNPILGTGGNVGKRDLAKAAINARKLLESSDSASWLHGTLTGTQSVALPDFSNGGTWFVYANKTFNSGQGWYREGKLSPWSFLFALEGALQLAGGAHKRLGSRARPYAVFPFVSDPASPVSAGEVGMTKGEFWAPLWAWPATTIEARLLFQRGLARLGGNAVKAPHEFAVAALAAGVDAGITEFARFELRQTTSSQVYEAIPRPHIRVGISSKDANIESSIELVARREASHLLMELIESRWLDRLPFEPRDAKQRGKYVGLRGPIESAILSLSEQPGEAERWQELLLRLAEAQFRVDRNKRHRERCWPLPLLSHEWFSRAWPTDQRCDEIEMAAAIASITVNPSPENLRRRASLPAFPLLINVFGVDVQARLARRARMHFTIRFPKASAQRRVWHFGDPLRVLIGVAQRRLVDAADSDAMLTTGLYPCSARIIDRLLSADPVFDLELVTKWIPALTLINWSCAQYDLRPKERTEHGEGGQESTEGRSDQRTESQDSSVCDGISLLDALFRPFFQPGKLKIGRRQNRRLLFDPAKEQLPAPAVSRQVFNLIRQGALDAAFDIARSGYRAAQVQTVPRPVSLDVDPLRLAAALLVPMRADDLQFRFNRWVQMAKSESPN
ncbi:MAG: type I-U CRISPR-associated protein Csx17 [Planctomycetes bacterium]|nr:type I-U CRISPR-associated protein Csx17 [Planctomycetota bacterium]